MDTKTRQYENFLRNELIHPATQEEFEKEKSKPNGSLSEAMQIKFGSTNLEALPLLHSAQDILGDSDIAIEEFKEYIIKRDVLPTSEMYLLIYGVLNAVYIQVQALETFYDIFNIDKDSSKLPDIKKLSIMQLRHKVAAHPLNYGRTRKTPESFRLIRASVTDPQSISVMNHRNEVEEFNILKGLEEFSSQKELLLNDFIKKVVGNFHSSDLTKKNKLLKKLQLIADGKLKSSTV